MPDSNGSAPHTPSNPPPQWTWPLLGCLTFPIFMCCWKFGVDIVMTIISLLIYVMQTNTTPKDPLVALRGDLLGMSFFLGMGGIVVAAWALNALIGRLTQFGIYLTEARSEKAKRVTVPRDSNGLQSKWTTKSAFAFRRPSVFILVIAIVMGFFVGHLPGWIAQKLGEWAPSLVNNGALELVEKMLLEGPILGRAISIAAVCIGAPILEELIFRGFLWVLISRTIHSLCAAKNSNAQTGEVSALVLTSLMFAVFHMDPIQSTALLFTAFALGWLRYISKSIWPCVALHFVNNTLAATLAIFASDWEPGLEISPVFAVSCAFITLVLCSLCWPFRRKED